MAKRIREAARPQELESTSLSGLIHQHVRVAIETAVHEELRAALGVIPYERNELRCGYRNGAKTRTLTGRAGRPHPATRDPVRRRERVDVSDRAAVSAADAGSE
jgi:transposase-like protein